MNILDLFKRKSKGVPIAASFEMTGNEVAPAVNNQRLTRVGRRKAGGRKVSASGKQLKVVAMSSSTSKPRPAKKKIFKSVIKKIGRKPSQTASVAPAPRKTPIRTALKSKSAKKAGKIALIAAAPIAAGAFLAIKNRKKIAAAPKKVFKAITRKPKTKAGKVARIAAAPIAAGAFLALKNRKKIVAAPKKVFKAVKKIRFKRKRR